MATDGVRAMPYLVRPMTADDVPRCEAVERGASPALLPPTDFAAELGNRIASYLVADPGGGGADGVVGLWYMAGEAHVVSLAVRADRRRRGVGELLAIAAIEQARRRAAALATLEVRESNAPARGLYAKCGFTERGVRRGYYPDNREDAVIMTTGPLLEGPFLERFAAQVRSHEARWGRSVRRTA